MSLLDDVKHWYTLESYPADGPELDMEEVGGEWVSKDTDTEQVSYKVIDDSPRWGDRIQVVYKRGDELVAVQDVRPATEMQDWGDYGDPDIFEVKAVEVTVTKYERV